MAVDSVNHSYIDSYHLMTDNAVDVYNILPLHSSINPNTSPVDATCRDLYSVGVTVLLAIIISLVAIVTIAGNTLVVAAFATDRKLRSFGNYFILNLAISDLIVGLLICVYAPYMLRGCWQLTRAGCLVFTFLDYVVPLASAWNMALISLDRYWSVARPIDYRLLLNTKRAVLLMTIPWIAGTLWYGPTVLFWDQFTGRQTVTDGRCQVAFFDHVGYLVASSFVEFLAPFVTVATINILIYVNIRRRSRGLVTSVMKPTNNPDKSRGLVTSSNDAADSLRKTSKAKNTLSRDKKSARSLAILVIVFLVTWGPFEVSAFVNPVCSFCIPDSASEVVFWLLWLNSTINPILYPFLQQRFRVAFTRILCRVFTPVTRSSAAWSTSMSPAVRRPQRVYAEVEGRSDCAATSVC